MTQFIQTPEQQFYLAKLLGYSYNIVYKPGAQNRVADALSRIHCLALSIPHMEFISKLKEQLIKDQEFQQFLTKVQDQPNDYKNFQVLNDLVFFKGKLFLPSGSPLKQTLLEEFHASLIGGHSGIHRTFGRLQENVFWFGMRKDVEDFVKACVVCQQTKSATHAPYGLLQPLPIPEKVWEDISMDFIVGLPSFQTHTVILVVVDRLSKAAHFGMLSTHYTAARVAELFAIMVCKLHGMPRSIVSDRDPVFLSHFWQELFRLSGTKLRMSTAYHPQSDGQTEIVNKILQQYLRCFVHNKPKQWGLYLHWAEWHYNSATHTTTGLSPFQVVYGRPPPALTNYVPGSTQLQAVEATLLDRDTMLQELKNKLLKAQVVMKEIADQSRIPHKFVVGEVAFELELPPTSKIHPMFHVSQLKPCFGDVNPIMDLPAEAVDNQPLIQPLSMMDWKWHDESQEWQVLIQWEGLFPEDSTWESYQDIVMTYPNFHLEDK
ncbi:hypothetical protein A2U01_0005450, partial [Trifolium medium]|nr:hypothetical protein [Trifolium medium]